MKHFLTTEIQYLKGVGPESAKKFKNLGIEKVEDLMTFAPRRYAVKSIIKDLLPDEEVCVTGKIIETGTKRTRTGEIFIVKISDGTGILYCNFFNYSKKARASFQRDKELTVEGQTSIWAGKLHLINPSVSFFIQNENKLLPIYPLTANFTHNYIRKVVKNALMKNTYIEETLPSHIIAEENLLSRKDAICNLHFPENISMARKAHLRFEYEEIFWLQILLALRREKNKNNGIVFKKGCSLARKFLDMLTKEKPGFKLTKSQIKVCNEIFEDMEKGHKMNRLLQGDVGAGKTIVAIFAILKAVESGYQVAFMAPTEILAEQHCLYMQRYLPQIDVQLRLLTSNIKGANKRKTIEEINNGDEKVVVGTHALIEGKIKFKNLGLVVIDEQHRFGVQQRSKIVGKGYSPDTLVLTATPIPRSMALTYYGDLDLSVITEIPPGVPPVATVWKKDTKIDEVWDFVKSELDKGMQAYVVYPVIEESEKLDLKAAEESYEKLKQTVFKNYNVGLLHGLVKKEAKDEVMQDFRAGKINILIATTVIEVGIDVPNASCMVIEHAERFGLAQLHQLRGRLHRGRENSYCTLVSYGNLSDIALKRLNTIVQENDGFKLAEKDLELRGPGEFLGIKQHGLPEVKFANLMDTKLLSRIREYVFKIIAEDPGLEKPENQVIQQTLKCNYSDKLKLLDGG